VRRPELGRALAGAQTGFVDLPESYYHRMNSAEAAVTKKKTDNETDTDRLWDAATKAKEEAEKMRDAATHAVAVVHVAHEALAVAQKKAAEAKVAADKAERHALDEAEKARKALETQLNLARQDQTQPPQNESTGGYAANWDLRPRNRLPCRSRPPINRLTCNHQQIRPNQRTKPGEEPTLGSRGLKS
jgi:hypothetical protein